MYPPIAAYLDGGRRLHLQHGPIDLILGAEGDTATARADAFDVATHRFQTVLDVLVTELPYLRRALRPDAALPSGPVARRMTRAALACAGGQFVTPMIAVAGAVADEVLATICDAVPLTRAYVNNGGDISVHLKNGAGFSVAMANPRGQVLGTVRFNADSRIGGIATSGTAGRSLSFGIAESVTVLARDAATADAAATLISNAVDLPGHGGIRREAASILQPDSDLGDRRVVTSVPPLSQADCITALDGGRALAQDMMQSSLILGAALHLQGESRIVGRVFATQSQIPETLNA